MASHLVIASVVASVAVLVKKNMVCKLTHSEGTRGPNFICIYVVARTFVILARKAGALCTELLRLSCYVLEVRLQVPVGTVLDVLRILKLFINTFLV